VAICDQFPAVAADELIAAFVPPPRFRDARFSNYIPNPTFPSQAAAVAAGQVFAARPPKQKRRLFKAPPPELRPGLYFDGGFGVGKTHLLASVWHAGSAPKVFGTFVEFTNLVGALGFAQAAEQLSDQSLVCIDEFELDDPGDTVLMSTLLGRLTTAGVRVAATSNTLPDRLGEGRFAADDFLREIQALSAQFDVVRVDGDDYRHRGDPEAVAPRDDRTVGRGVAESASLDDFADVMNHLTHVHPSRYGPMVEGISQVHLRGLTTLTDQSAALRLVVLIDRLYDRDIPVMASGVPADKVFDQDMLTGGYRKKYFRAMSRLIALTREASVD